ncbi:MAG: AmmeMemoRadiSam system protein B [Opitutae bacterium]|nr:AmmeMemoRadiSam system protein B [Opitutae bacterium]
MDVIRDPAAAGHFYSVDKGRLASVVDRFLADASSSDLSPKAIIAPHTGYEFSGLVDDWVFRPSKICWSKYGERRIDWCLTWGSPCHLSASSLAELIEFRRLH